MKLMRNTTAIMLLVLGALVANVTVAAAPQAKGELVLTLKPLDERSLALLSVHNLVNNEARLSITDQDGNLIFAKTFRDKSIVLEKINFSRLEKGVYSLEVVSENKLARQSFEIGQRGELTVEGNFTTESLLPKVIQKEKSVFVSFNNQGGEEVVVNIYDDNNNLIHQELSSSLKMFGRKYNLAQLNEGIYRLEIKAGSKIYEQKVNLK